VHSDCVSSARYNSVNLKFTINFSRVYTNIIEVSQTMIILLFSDMQKNAHIYNN